MSARKWQPGEPLTALEAITLILAGSVIYDRGKVQPAAWMANYSLPHLRRLSALGLLRRAEPFVTECAEPHDEIKKENESCLN